MKEGNPSPRWKKKGEICFHGLTGTYASQQTFNEAGPKSSWETFGSLMPDLVEARLWISSGLSITREFSSLLMLRPEWRVATA